MPNPACTGFVADRRITSFRAFGVSLES